MFGLYNKTFETVLEYQTHHIGALDKSYLLEILISFSLFFANKELSNASDTQYTDIYEQAFTSPFTATAEKASDH